MGVPDLGVPFRTGVGGVAVLLNTVPVTPAETPRFDGGTVLTGAAVAAVVVTASLWVMRLE